MSNLQKMLIGGGVVGGLIATGVFYAYTKFTGKQVI